MLMSLLPLLGAGDALHPDGIVNSVTNNGGFLVMSLFGMIAWLFVEHRLFITEWFMSWFMVTATFESGNQTYSWMITWAAEQPEWKCFRQVTVNGLDNPRSACFASRYDKEDLDSEDKYMFYPASGSWLYRRIAGVPVFISFHEPLPGDFRLQTPATVTVRALTSNRDILDNVVVTARDAYKRSRTMTRVYSHGNCLGQYNNPTWEISGALARRSLDTVIVESSVKSKLIEDTRDFMRSKQWYSNRGIPYRRGYLFHGVPGSGKTSLTQAIASDLNLDICVVTLSKVDDASLPVLLSRLPEQSIAIMEDIDVALTQNRAKDQNSGYSESFDKSGLTLSGLLNAIDGFNSQEGHILFATTNKYSDLDPALKRPGRFDVHINFMNAKRAEAAELFQKFYMPGDALKNMDWVTLRRLADLEDSAEPARSEEAAYPISHETEKSARQALKSLAEQFSSAIPDCTYSMAQLQGFLLLHKTQPEQAAKCVQEWLSNEAAKDDSSVNQAASASTIGLAAAGADDANSLIVLRGAPNVSLVDRPGETEPRREGATAAHQDLLRDIRDALSVLTSAMVSAVSENLAERHGDDSSDSASDTTVVCLH